MILVNQLVLRNIVEIIGIPIREKRKTKGNERSQYKKNNKNILTHYLYPKRKVYHAPGLQAIYPKLRAFQILYALSSP